MATRSPRRSGAGRASRASRSTRRSAPPRGRPRSRRMARRRQHRPSDVSATIRWRAPYSAGRMSSVIPASRTTWRPPRSRTCRTRASSQPDRATSVAPRFDGEAGRVAGPPGSRPSSAGSSRANRAGAGAGSSRPKTGKPPPTSSVSNASIEPRHSAATRQAASDRIAPRVDGAELRPHVEVDPARPERPVRAAATLDRVADLHLGHPELGATGADRQAGLASRARRPG